MVATQKQTHNYIKYYRVREGGGRPGGVGGGRETLYFGTYTGISLCYKRVLRQRLF